MIVLHARAGTEQPRGAVKRYFSCTVAPNLWSIFRRMPHRIDFVVDIIPQSLPEGRMITIKSRDDASAIEVRANFFERLDALYTDGLKIMQGGENVFAWLVENAKGKFSIYASDELWFDFVMGSSDVTRTGRVHFADHRDAVAFAMAFQTK